MLEAKCDNKGVMLKDIQADVERLKIRCREIKRCNKRYKICKW